MHGFYFATFRKLIKAKEIMSYAPCPSVLTQCPGFKKVQLIMVIHATINMILKMPMSVQENYKFET